MQATVYVFDNGDWRSRTRSAGALGGRDPDQFFYRLDALLRRLGDLHLRISLARLPPADEAADAARLGQAIVDNLLDPCAVAGLMPDGSVVAAFLGPRGGDIAMGDEEMAGRIARRFERALRTAQTGRPAASAGLTVAHCWSDEIYDVPSLVLELASVRRTRHAGNVVEHDSSRKPA